MCSVAEFSKHETDLYPNPDIYEHFIFPFLMHHNTSDPQCVSSANSSAEWLIKNFGVYSTFPSITDFYKLNPYFSGLEVLPLLSPKQIAGMLLSPLPTPPEKDVVIDRVFDFLFESPEDARLPEVLHELLYLINKVNPPCDVYRQIFERLYGAIPDLPRDVEPFIWSYIDQLLNVAPEDFLLCHDGSINSSSSLLMLGSLVVGIPSKTFGSISGSQLLTASKDPSFLEHITTASSIVQQTFVTQIISVNTNSEMIIQNVPDELASEIPRALLLGLSGNSSVLTTLNKKKWKRQQCKL
ncbi:uncharacterized protein [Notothenia coriiceps]|uniref:Uncharacterized protein n=1 Tax=Notothenia coriiceps TaxID=8208 RepID=A0A6I9NPE4_9TELE|nr:PREDICTED: uncharacterized protein LOC104951410 [Notothenia coriiceps]